MKVNFEKLNAAIKETIEKYYRDHDADSFFAIVDLLDFCNDRGLTKDEVPQLIEMKNIIVMG